MIRKWLAAVFLVLLAVLSACAGNGHWYKPDKMNFDRDVLECKTSAQYTYLIYYPNNQPPQVLEGFDQGIFNRCMKVRGYEWVNEEKRRAAK